MADDPVEFTEAQRIQSDQTHPDHSKWEAGDPETVAKVERGYQAKYGPGGKETSDESDELNPELQRLKELYEKGGSSTSENPEGKQGDPWDFNQEQGKEALRQAWGPEYEPKMEAAQTYVEKVFGTFEDKQFLQELFNVVGNHPSALKLLIHLSSQ